MDPLDYDLEICAGVSLGLRPLFSPARPYRCQPGVRALADQIAFHWGERDHDMK